MLGLSGRISINLLCLLIIDEYLSEMRSKKPNYVEIAATLIYYQCESFHVLDEPRSALSGIHLAHPCLKSTYELMGLLPRYYSRD